MEGVIFAPAAHPDRHGRACLSVRCVSLARLYCVLHGQVPVSNTSKQRISKVVAHTLSAQFRWPGGRVADGIALTFSRAKSTGLQSGLHIFLHIVEAREYHLFLGSHKWVFGLPLEYLQLLWSFHLVRSYGHPLVRVQCGLHRTLQFDCTQRCNGFFLSSHANIVSGREQLFTSPFSRYFPLFFFLSDT